MAQLHLDSFGLLITVIAGFGWGSFATMATWRLPRNMPWIGDRPRCFSCKHPLNIIDYFSVISYFLWKGKCRYCHQSYEASLSYFLTEVGMTLFFLLAYTYWGFGDMFVITTSLVVATIILAVIDAEHRKIPAKVLISLLVIGVIYRTWVDHSFYGVIYSGFLGAVVGLLIRRIYFSAKGQKEIAHDYTRWQHGDRFAGPGFDYVKLLAISSIWLPYHLFPSFVAINGMVIVLWRMLHPKSLRIGTVLALSLTLTVIYQPAIIAWVPFF